MLLNLLLSLISGLIDLIPFEFPELPINFYNIIDTIFDGMISALGIIDIFINLSFWLQCASIMLVAYNIRILYNGAIWVINLIPGVELPRW